MVQILVIDDDPTARLIISRSLKNQGYKVILAEDGESGFAAALELQPSLIICDWTMPMMDGLEVCRRVRETESLANSYFILLTARGEVSDLVQGLENGADDFLAKPANPSELRARVNAGLRLHKANHDLQVQKQLLEQELSQAAGYVRSLLPEDLEGVVRTRSCFIPSIQLGGDCFDYYWLDEDNFVIYLLDVSGHGVGAALLSVSIQNLLRSARYGAPLLPTEFHNPQKVLMSLNDYFQMPAHQEMYFTIWYGVYNRVTQTITYAVGGHPPAILVCDGQVKKLKTSGLPIGIIPNFPYESATCEVPLGSSLYVFSDGTYEIMLPDEQLWGMEGLLEVLKQPQREGTSKVEDILASIRKAAVIPNMFEDDLSLVEVQFIHP